MRVTYFDIAGHTVGAGPTIALPDYLDRLDIQTKAHWFTLRGGGDPRAVSVLFNSQGQQYLISQLSQPLRNLKYHELKEIENGLEEQTLRYHDQCGRGSIGGSQ
jgi:hypothetical protein